MLTRSRFFLLVPLVILACQAQPSPTQAFGSLTLHVGEDLVWQQAVTCTWYESTAQLFVEAPDSEAPNYVLLAAPLDWLGEPLPEGPGEPAEMTLRTEGAERPIDQDSLTGTMTATQTEGTLNGRLTDGTTLTGEWECPEVVEE